VVDGKNMTVDIDGRYSLRPGYVTTLASVPAGGLPIMGGLFFSLTDGSQSYIVFGTTTTWYNIPRSIPLGTATAITGTAATGTYRNPWRFVLFPQGTPTATYVIGANNKDATRRWKTTDAAYANIAAAPICKDLTVLANRVVAVNTSLAGARVVSQVMWSALNDATTWPATAVVNLFDSDDKIIGIKNTGRTSAVIYRNASIWSMTARAGGDATAFSFEKVFDAPGPMSSASVVSYGGAHYYLAVDLKVYRFDGTQALPISGPIDPVLNADYGLLEDRDCVHGAVFPALRQIWWFFPIGSGGVPNVTEAVVLNLDSGTWNVKYKFAHDLRCSFNTEHITSANLPDKLFYMYVGDSATNLHIVDFNLTDNGTAIDYDWKTPKVSPDSRATYLPDEIENYFLQQATAGEEITVNVDAWEQPEALTSTTLIEGIHDLAAGPRFQLVPPKDLSLTATGRFMQGHYSGTATKRVAWSGGFLYVYPEVA